MPQLARREQIHAALITILKDMDEFDADNVWRNRDEDPTNFPTVVLFDGSDAPAPNRGFGGVDRMLTVDIDIFAKSADGPALGADLTALYTAIYKALVTADDLQGLVTEFEAGPVGVDALADSKEAIGQLSATFNLEYRHHSLDPALPATASP